MPNRQFDIPGFPVIRQDNSLPVELSTTDFQTATLELHARTGTISTATLTPDSNAANEMFGTVTLPSSPFVFYVVGKNTAREAYQRVIPTIVKTQTVRVIPPKSADLYPRLNLVPVAINGVTSASLPQIRQASPARAKSRSVCHTIKVVFQLTTAPVQFHAMQYNA